MADELNAENEAIKAPMTEADTVTIMAGAFKITWKPVASTSIDFAVMCKDLPEIWQEYCNIATTRRFFLWYVKPKSGTPTTFQITEQTAYFFAAWPKDL